MRTDTEGQDFQDRAEHWAELQEHVHRGPVEQEETSAPDDRPIIFDPLCGDPWPVEVTPRDIAKAALALDPIWRTLAVALVLCILAAIGGWALNG